MRERRELSIITYSSLRKNPLLVVVVITILSIFVAYVCFNILQSSAQVENELMSIGGGIAGFFVCFHLTKNLYLKLGGGSSVDDRITVLVEDHLEGFKVPEGFKKEVSTDFKFGIAYPKEWVFSRLPQMTVYGKGMDLENDVGFNIVIEDVSDADITNRDEFYESALQSAAILTNAEIIFSEIGIISNLRAIKWRLDTKMRGEIEMTSYQVGLLDERMNRLYILTFTTIPENFDRDRAIFDNIANTFRIS